MPHPKICLYGGVLSITMATSMAFSADSASRSGRNPLLQNVDVRIAGPGGEVLVYYKEGNDIVVRNCGDDYGNIKSRNDEACKKGPENRVPVDEFKRALKAQFLVGDGDKLKPMTADELKAYRGADTDQLDKLKAREKELDAKLARIKAFINENGADDKSTGAESSTDQLLESVRSQLATAQSGGNAVDKVNKLVDHLVDEKIGNDKVWEKVSAGNSGTEATYTLLRQFDASRGECGTDEILDDPKRHNPGTVPGRSVTRLESLLMIQPVMAAGHSIEDRVNNCIVLPNAVKTTKSGVQWNLVARKRDPQTGKFYEVWKDCGKKENGVCDPKGLIWSDRIDKSYSHRDAVHLDSKGNVTGEPACRSNEGKTASAGIQDKSFGVPTIEEIMQAEKNGIREVLPNMWGRWFWSSSVYPHLSGVAYFFSGFNGRVDTGFRVNTNSVRCVGR